jgi:putative transposase
VLFAIDIASRKVEIAGVAVNPGGAWMEQSARNLVDAVDGFLLGKRYLLTDRDPPYTRGFRDILRAISEYLRDYHEERNHPGLDNALLTPRDDMDGTGKVVHRDRLGGLLGLYYRKAA